MGLTFIIIIICVIMMHKRLRKNIKNLIYLNNKKSYLNRLIRGQTILIPTLIITQISITITTTTTIFPIYPIENLNSLAGIRFRVSSIDNFSLMITEIPTSIIYLI